METKFTPGPWEVHKGIDRSARLFVCELGAHGFKVFSEHRITRIPSYSLASTEADAHLIASAPDLYEVLETTLLHLQHPNQFENEEVIKQIKKVLAQARGEG